MEVQTLSIEETEDSKRGTLGIYKACEALTSDMYTWKRMSHLQFTVELPASKYSFSQDITTDRKFQTERLQSFAG